MIDFVIVDSSCSREAYQWHRGFAASNDCIFPRPWVAYERLANEGRLWCARAAGTGDFLALAYFCLEDNEWEIGGLMVATQERGKGVGSIIARLTLGHVLVDETPLARGQRVISHVHLENVSPRALIEKCLKFRFSRRIQVPGSVLPGLRTNANGDVEGDEFELARPDTLESLAQWCDSWNGKLRDGRDARILLRDDMSLDIWARALRAM